MKKTASKSDTSNDVAFGFLEEIKESVEENAKEKKKEAPSSSQQPEDASQKNITITNDNKIELQQSEDSVGVSENEVKDEPIPNNKNTSENAITETQPPTFENTEDILSHKEKFKEIILRENISSAVLKTGGKQFLIDRYGHELKDNFFFQQYSITEIITFVTQINSEKTAVISKPPKKEDTTPKKLEDLFKNAQELSNEDLEPMEFVIKDFLPSAGAFLLSSKPKTGKTFLALQMAASVASGDNFLDMFSVQQGNVLYVMTQGGRRALKKRICDVMKDKKGLDDLFYLTALPSLRENGYDTLKNFIDLAKNPKLIVLDMITNMVPNIKHSNYQAWAEVFEELNNFGVDNDISILCVYHSRKEVIDDSDFTDDVLGSTGILGSVSGILSLRRSRDKGEGEIFINHREAESMKKTLLFKDACWKYLGDDLPKRSTDKKIFFLLKTSEGLNNTEIAKKLGKDKGNVNKALKRMIEEGFVYIHETRYYLR